MEGEQHCLFEEAGSAKAFGGLCAPSTQRDPSEAFWECLSLSNGATWESVGLFYSRDLFLIITCQAELTKCHLSTLGGPTH